MSNNLIKERFTSEDTATAKIYCFTIKLQQGGELYLNSSSEIIEVDGKRFIPQSGLELVKLCKNDSAEDFALINGVYDEAAIQQDYDLCGAKIHIGLYLKDTIQNLAIYYCSKYDKLDLEFEIRAEPLTSRYSSDAILKFSKTCRATLGDRKCKVDLAKFAKEYIVEQFKGKSVVLSDVKEKAGYFNSGVAELYGNGMKLGRFCIKSHIGNIINLDQEQKWDFTAQFTLKLYPGCDKKLITCCNNFNNVLNFRGEPFVPEFKILEN